MKTFWTKEKVELLEAYAQTNMTKLQIGKKMKKSLDSISHALRRYDIQRPTKMEVKTDASYDVVGLNDEDYTEAKTKAKTQWKIAKERKTKKKGNDKDYSIYLVTSDHHIPHQNTPAQRAIFKLMDDVAFDGNIILGDYMDMAPISHWNRNKKKTLETKRLKEDYIVGNAVLDEYDKRLPKHCDKRFFWGNHENWYNDLIDEMPALEGLLDPKTELHLDERGYTTYEKMNHIEKIGKLNFTHGMYTSMHYVKKHIDEFKSNVIFGHLHSPRMRCETAVGHETAMAGYCLGCLCDMNPDYMKNRPNKWAHGFAVVYFYKDGTGQFDVDLKRIVKGKFIFNNRLYDGNK